MFSGKSESLPPRVRPQGALVPDWGPVFVIFLGVDRGDWRIGPWAVATQRKSPHRRGEGPRFLRDPQGSRFFLDHSGPH